MAKLIRYCLFISCFFANCAYAQDSAVVIVCLKWRTSTEASIMAYRTSNDTIFERRGRTSVGKENLENFDRLTHGNKYYYFIDKKNRKMIEGPWTPEGMTGSFIFYHKNGTVRVRGAVTDFGNCGTWYYYNKKGQLKKTKVFDSCN